MAAASIALLVGACSPAAPAPVATRTSARATSSAGPVAAYGFSEGTGTSIADTSGNANNGTAVNATWSTAGRFGNALSFNGTSSWVTVADSSSLHLTTGMTLEAWVKPTAVAGWTEVLGKETTDDVVYTIYSSVPQNRPTGFVRKGGVFSQAGGTTKLAANTWTHLATTYDGARLRFFVNGTRVSSTPATGAIDASSGVFRIGGNSIFGEYFNGLIDEVRVYNRALSTTEVNADKNTAVNTSTPPTTTPPTTTAPDTTAPTDSVTAPAAGTVSGTVTVSADASDNVGIAGVQFKLDTNINVGAQDSSSPFRVSWASGGVANGTHTLSAVARDAAGNATTSAPVTVTVNNTPASPPTTPPTTTLSRDAYLWPFAANSWVNTPIANTANYGTAAPFTWGNINAGSWSVGVALSPAIAPQPNGSDASTCTWNAAKTTIVDSWGLPGLPGYVVTVDARGSAYGAGTTAIGVPVCAGIIRTEELSANKIPHALALALTADLLSPSAFQWPAIYVDNDAAATNTGTIPYGTLFAIPPSVNVANLGLSSSGLALAHALQDYGAYIVNRSGANALYATTSAEGMSQLDQARASTGTVMSLLRRVNNNTAATPGGGPAGSTRRAPSAPPFG